MKPNGFLMLLQQESQSTTMFLFEVGAIKQALDM
jgi:hypothetical protein